MNKKHTSDTDAGKLDALRNELEETQRSLQMLMSIVNTSPAVVCLWQMTDDLPVEFISDSIEQFGYSADELRSGEISFNDIVPPEDMEHLKADSLEYFDQGIEEYTTDYRIYAKSGEVRWVKSRNTVVRDSDDQVTHLQGIILDITEERTTLIALQQSEEKYRAVVESSSEAICTLNADGVFLFMNAVCAQRLGGTVEQLVGKTLWDVFPKEFADREAIRAQNAIGSGQSNTIEVYAPLGGEMRWYQISMEPIREHDQQVHSTLVIARDIHEHKTALIALKTSEEHLQAIMASLHQTAILVYTPDGYILSCWASSEMDTRYGIDTNALAGKHLRDVFPLEIAEMRLQSINNVYKSGWSVRDDWLATFPNGQFWIETTLSPLKDPDGNIINIVAFARDITDRKQTEKLLKQSEQRYKALFEGTSEGILVADIETQKYLFANPAICEMMNYSAEEFLEMTIANSHPPEDLDHVVECFQAQARGDYKVATNIPFQTRDGKVIYADVSARLIKFEGRGCAVGFIHDLTETRRAEEQLRQSEQRYRTLFEGANEGILVVDIETRKLVFSNPAVQNMLKYRKEELLTMSIEDWHRSEDIEHVMNEFYALIHGESKLAPAIPFVTGDGEIVFADVGATIIRLEGRDCIVGFLRDLTEARRTEEALKIAHVKLMAARDEERKHLAAELHDSVNQKLVALGMQLGKITNVNGPAPTKTCNELIADIRGICHGLYPPALEALGLIPAMRQLKEYGKSAGIITTIQCDPVIERVRLAPEIEIALFRIAQEAVNNVIRHSGASTIDIDLVRYKQKLVMAIVDNGAGFDIKAEEGKGLGLSSIKDRANAIAAKLTVSSEPGETRIEVSVKTEFKETNQKEEQ
jgi:PAS domain S-box-containing protein